LKISEAEKPLAAINAQISGGDLAASGCICCYVAGVHCLSLTAGGQKRTFKILSLVGYIRHTASVDLFCPVKSLRKFQNETTLNSKTNRRERGIWQKLIWERGIRDDV